MFNVKANEILDIIETMFPNADCELVHRNAYELLVAVVLSAQTTDVAVNKVTPALFEKFPTVNDMALAIPKEIEPYIQSIGLYRNKAKNLVSLAKSLVESYDGIVPNTMEELVKLDGVGRKTANVILSEWYKIPALAVDTHVERVSKRLGLVKKDATVLEVELTLKKKIKKERWRKTHHLLIFFGRYHCKALKPDCNHCPLFDVCKDKKMKSKIKMDIV